MVELSRTYQEPDLPLSQKKSDIIRAKKTVLIGEVVNGGPLLKPPHHSPVCSFDSQNKYRGEGPMVEATPGQITGSPSIYGRTFLFLVFAKDRSRYSVSYKLI